MLDGVCVASIEVEDIPPAAKPGTIVQGSSAQSVWVWSSLRLLKNADVGVLLDLTKTCFHFPKKYIIATFASAEGVISLLENELVQKVRVCIL